MKNQNQNTQPLISKDGKGLKRKFLGNLFPKSTIENKELKAYIRGQSSFNYKKDQYGNPNVYEVRQEYYYA